MQNSRFHVRSIWMSLTLWKEFKKLQLIENSNDVYIILRPMSATCYQSLDGMNYCIHEKSWINILKERNVLRRQITNWSSEWNCHVSENFGFRCCATPIIITSIWSKCYFYTHEPYFLRSGTKSHCLILKNMNLNKVALLFFGQSLIMFLLWGEY